MGEDDFEESFLNEVIDGLKEIEAEGIGEHQGGDSEVQKELLKWANRKQSEYLSKRLSYHRRDDCVLNTSFDKVTPKEIKIVTCLNSNGISDFFEEGLDYELKKSNGRTMAVIDNYGNETEVFCSKFSEPISEVIG